MLPSESPRSPHSPHICTRNLDCSSSHLHSVSYAVCVCEVVHLTLMAVFMNHPFPSPPSFTPAHPSPSPPPASPPLNRPLYSQQSFSTTRVSPCSAPAHWGLPTHFVFVSVSIAVAVIFFLCIAFVSSMYGVCVVCARLHWLCLLLSLPQRSTRRLSVSH